MGSGSKALQVLVVCVALLSTVSGCAIHGPCGYRECPEESAIRATVEGLYAQYPELRPPNQLYVQVRGHTVTVSGQVNTEYERRLAESVARQATGVTGVVNMIGLTYSGR